MSYLSSQINSHSCERRQPNMVSGQLMVHLNARSSSHGFPEVNTLDPLPTNRLPILLQWDSTELYTIVWYWCNQIVCTLKTSNVCWRQVLHDLCFHGEGTLVLSTGHFFLKQGLESLNKLQLYTLVWCQGAQWVWSDSVRSEGRLIIPLWRIWTAWYAVPDRYFMLRANRITRGCQLIYRLSLRLL